MRESSTSTYPAGVAVQKVDFGSVESLTPALAGQDAVVSTIATLGVGSQGPLVDAAFNAGVKRFIPSEFGINTRTLGDLAIGKILGGKIAVVNKLQELSEKKPEFSWTGVTNGLFFEFVSRAPALSEKGGHDGVGRAG